MLSFEERQILKQRISAIQTVKETRAKRMWVMGVSGEKIHLGGGSRPLKQQNRAGYSNHHLPNDDAFAFGRKNLAA